MPRQEALIRQLYVKIDGILLDQAVMDDLFDVRVDSSLRLPEMCALVLHDANATYTNQGPFTLGAALEVGVSDEQGRGDRSIFKGEITSLEPDYAEGTLVKLTVRAYDRSHRLHRGANTKAYVNMSDSEIAQQIALSLSLQAEVEPSSVVHKHVYQDSQTHIEFLRERARRIGYEVYVRDRTLYYKKSDTTPPQTITLEWGQQLRSFKPVLSLINQVNEVQVKGWDPASKREIVGRATESSARPQIGESQSGAQIAQTSFGEAAELGISALAMNQAEADKLAQAILDKHAGTFVQAEGCCYGQPELKAGCLVDLKSLGTRFNGKYLVTSVTHEWDTRQDYVTRFTIHGRRGETLLELLGAAPGAGESRGLYCLPEVNDEVLVVFEEGDIGRPIVISGIWNGVDKPPVAIDDVQQSGNVVKRVFYSRKGHKIVIYEDRPA